MLVHLDNGLPASTTDAHWDDFIVEESGSLSCDSAAMRLGREGVLVTTGDAVRTAHILGCLDHPTGNRVMTAAGGDPTSCQPVIQQLITPSRAPSGPKAVVLNAAHALGSASDDDVCGTSLHTHRRIDDGLQTRPATTVHLHSWHRHGQASVECSHPAQCRRFA
jgi:hypothetical protein